MAANEVPLCDDRMSKTTKYTVKKYRIKKEGGRFAKYTVRSKFKITELAEKNAKVIVESQEAVVVGFFKDLDSADAKVFKSVASEMQMDNFSFCITSDSAVYSELKATKDGVTFFKKYAEDRKDFDGELTEEALTKFLKSDCLEVIDRDIKTQNSYKEHTEKLISCLKEIEVQVVAWNTMKVLYKNEEFLKGLLQENEVLNFETLLSPELKQKAEVLFTDFNNVYVPSLSFQIGLKILDILGASAEVEKNILVGFESLMSSLDKTSFLHCVVNLNDHLLKLIAKYNTKRFHSPITIFQEPNADLNLLCLELVKANRKKADCLLWEIYYVGKGCFQYSSLIKETIGNLLPKAIMPISHCIVFTRLDYEQNKLRSYLIKRSALEYLKTTYCAFPCQDKTVQDICPVKDIDECCSVLEKLLKGEIYKSLFIDVYPFCEKSEVPASHHWWARFESILE